MTISQRELELEVEFGSAWLCPLDPNASFVRCLPVLWCSAYRSSVGLNLAVQYGPLQLMPLTP